MAACKRLALKFQKVHVSIWEDVAAKAAATILKINFLLENDNRSQLSQALLHETHSPVEALQATHE